MEQVFYGGVRRRIGTVFEMDDKDIVRDAEGVMISPEWAMPASGANLLKEVRRIDEDRFLKGAIASSGTRFAKIKEQSFLDAMRGDGPPTQAERAALAASGTAGAKAKKAVFDRALAGDELI